MNTKNYFENLIKKKCCFRGGQKFFTNYTDLN